MKQFYRKSDETLISPLCNSADFTKLNVLRSQGLISFSSALIVAMFQGALTILVYVQLSFITEMQFHIAFSIWHTRLAT